MTRFTSFFGMSIWAAASLALSVVSSVSAHGYMTYPPPRGIQKVTNQVDDLQSPNTRGICRGEPVGQVTKIDNKITLKFHIGARHIGMCNVYILSPNLSNPRKIASKMNCAHEKYGDAWSIAIPSNIKGRKVLRWTWDAAHLDSQIEYYEQCADVVIGGNGRRRRSYRIEDNNEEVAPQLIRRDGEEDGEEEAASDEESFGDEAGAEAGTTNAETGSDELAAGGSCTPGESKCNGNQFGQCNHGSFVWRSCGAGTTCKSAGATVYCG